MGDEAPPTQEQEEARRRLRQRVFGEVLPEATRDDRDPAAPEASPRDEQWLRDNVPPHHG